MQIVRNTTAILIVVGIASLGGACDELTDTPTQARTPSFSHSGDHSGTFTVWSLNERVGQHPVEIVADLSNQSGHLGGGPVMITTMSNAFLAGGRSGNLYWNPLTNRFAYYGVGAFCCQFGVDLDRRAIPSTGLHGSFGGGNVWGTVHGSDNFGTSIYVQFRGTGNIRAYRFPANMIGIRVSLRDGKVYVAAFDGMLIELDPATNALRRWLTGNRPFYVELDALGRVYATAAAGGGFPDQIIRLDPATNVITRWTIPGGGLQSFTRIGVNNDITEDSEGNLWFSETASHEYGRLNPVTNVFEEFTKGPPGDPVIRRPNGIGTSGAGPTLQVYGQENAFPGWTDVLTRAAATPLVTAVPPTMSVVPTGTEPVEFVDLVRPRTDFVIIPTTTTVTSQNGSGIDRFPQPPGVFRPTGVTPVVLPNTIFGSVEGSHDVEQFVSTVIVAPPPPPICPPDDDDDNDGLNNSNESVLHTLLGVADSDGDGIVDGNDDANGNGNDDEDEDDGDECPDPDSDGDGTDDEDEDDEDD
jgi:hypothetical protein